MAATGRPRTARAWRRPAARHLPSLVPGINEPRMKRQNLIIARAGRSSLHPTWLSASTERNWDLLLCPYQTLEPLHDNAGFTVGDVLPGPKWTGLRQLLNRWQGWREYRYIWLPDDDIFATQDTINRFFTVSEALSLDLCAPALHESSYYSHFDTMRNQRCFARRCGFVEIMAPCFSVRALAELLHTLELSPTGWGWGLDSLWPKLLGYRNIGVIDAAPVLHTRPVGAFRDAALSARVRAESDHIMATYGCGQVHTTHAALDADLDPLTEQPEALTALLADGWRYLFERNPGVLPWLVQAQRPSSGWPDYPIAGTPACARP